MDNVSTLLAELDKANNESITVVRTPSGEFSFKPLLSTHDRLLLQAGLQSTIFTNQIHTTIYNILCDTCLGGKDQVNRMTKLDKLFVLMGLRASMNDTYQIKDNDGNVLSEMSLSAHIAKFQDMKTPEPVQVMHGRTKVMVGVPTLENENRYNQIIVDSINSNEMNPRFVTSLTSTIYFTDVFQHILSVVIEGVKTEDWASIAFNNQITILEKLPKVFLGKIFSAVDQINKVMEELRVVKYIYDEKEWHHRMDIESLLMGSI